MRTFLALLVCLATAVQVRMSAADWPNFGADPQHTGWAAREKTFTTGNVKDIVLAWKIKLPNTSKELNALTPPVAAVGMVIVAGSSDTLFAIEAKTGRLVWTKTFETDRSRIPARSDWLCPNALNATPLIHNAGDPALPKQTVFVLSSDGKLHGLSIKNGEDRFPPAQFTPPFSKNWSLNSNNGVIYTTSSQGCGNTKSGVWAMNFRTPEHKVTFVPSTNGNGAGVWGRGGATIGTTRLFGETGDGKYDAEKGNFPDTVLGISLDETKLADYYTPVNREYLTRKDLDMGNVSPVVFPFQGRELVAGAGKEGVIYLLDANSLGGSDHRTPLFRSPLYINANGDFSARGFWGALATWQDPHGKRWLFAPAFGPLTPAAAPLFPIKNGDAPNGSVLAFKVEQQAGLPVLSPVWVSRDFNSPEPPVVANGVVFAVSSGEFTKQVKEEGSLYSSKERAEKHAGDAVLFALDAATGRELYSSGNAMESFTHFSGLAVADGHVYVVTFDNTLYAFGLKR